MNHLKWVTFLSFLLNFQLMFAQAPDTLWTKRFGGIEHDVGYCVQTTIDGGYIITGRTESYGIGNNDVLLIKTDSIGNTLWTKTYGGTLNDGGYFVQQTSDSGFIIAGHYNSIYYTEFGNVWLIKTDCKGDTTWTKRFYRGEQDYGITVQQTTDGGYILVCSAYSFDKGGYDIWLLKTNASGDTVWTKTFGGIEDERGYSVKQTIDEGYIVVGSTKLFNWLDDIWLIKTDDLGDTMWTKVYQLDNQNLGKSVCQTSDGGYIISGYTYIRARIFKPLLIKTDFTGDTVWTMTIDGDTSMGYWGESTGIFNSVKQTPDSGFIISGTTENYNLNSSPDVWIIKTNANGDTIWTKFFGGLVPEEGNCIDITHDGGYIITGSTIDSTGMKDVWLLKIAPDLSTKILKDRIISKKYILKNNYPNPFNPLTSIEYQLPKASQVDLSIYNILGQKVATLVSKKQSAGTYKVDWDASGFSSGVYFYKLETTKGFVQTRKLVLLK